MEITVFEHKDFGQLRTVERDGELWFVGKDVAEKLGYADTSDALKKHVDGEDKGVGKMPTPGGNQNIIIINESGLYSLVLSSKLPTAKEFKRWVTSEVLPSIRKHGMYASEQLLNDPDLLIAMAQKLKDERKLLKTAHEKVRELNRTVEELTETIEDQQRRLDLFTPKAEYYDEVLHCHPEALTITDIAKQYGMTAMQLNELLHERGIQYRIRDTWYLYHPYANCGYTVYETTINGDWYRHTKHVLKWTEKGRKFIYDVLAKDWILPL